MYVYLIAVKNLHFITFFNKLQHKTHFSWVLTAAHCCVPGILDESDIILGSASRIENSETIIRKVADFQSHPSFNEYNYNNDICVIQLDRDVQYSDKIQPICLEDNKISSSENEGIESYIAGWGSKSATGAQKTNLNEAKVEIVDKQKCKENFPPGFLKESLYCVKGVSETIDVCEGDAGGPHVIKEKINILI